jgi:hypothetical protein
MSELDVKNCKLIFERNKLRRTENRFFKNFQINKINSTLLFTSNILFATYIS